MFLAIVGVWEAISLSGLVDALSLPRPSNILTAIFRLTVVQGNVWWHLWITTYEAVVGS